MLQYYIKIGLQGVWQLSSLPFCLTENQDGFLSDVAEFEHLSKINEAFLDGKLTSRNYHASQKLRFPCLMNSGFQIMMNKLLTSTR